MKEPAQQALALRAAAGATHGAFFDRRLHPSTPPQGWRRVARHQLHLGGDIGEASGIRPDIIYTTMKKKLGCHLHVVDETVAAAT